MDPLVSLLAAANRYKSNESPLEREKAIRRIAELISTGDSEFLEMAKRLLSSNGDKRNIGIKKDRKEDFW